MGHFLFVVYFILIVIITPTVMAKLTPAHLACEYMADPLIDIANPRLSWINTAEPGERGQRQTAWQECSSRYQATIQDTAFLHPS